MKIHKHMNRNRDSIDFMEVPDLPSHCGSDKPTFSQIRQAVFEIWPKRWTGYSCCYGNVMKIHNHINTIAPDFMDVPDQSSHDHSNK